ncbi:hypothetical protein [Elizabethkingia miricola]|uniref:hypothetical protein n=1 Tax=Elizabethkingia miricola TaxID=172045 RepID=UPI0038913713
MSLINFQFGEFESNSPNWFDWLSLLSSLIITALSIWFAYRLGERTYKRDKEDKASEEARNIQSENELFTNSLQELQSNVQKQIIFLKEYVEEKDFRLKINPTLQANFLKFLKIRTLYSARSNQEIATLNHLLASLYSNDTILENLRAEVNTFISKYNIHEAKFKNGYRQILYTKFLKFSHLRSINYRENEGRIEWAYHENDIFMQEYFKLTQTDISNEEGSTANHIKIDKNFLLPIIGLSKKYVPRDPIAIEVLDIANDAHSAYLDMQALTDAHFNTINSYLNTLEDLDVEIQEFLTT